MALFWLETKRISDYFLCVIIVSVFQFYIVMVIVWQGFKTIVISVWKT